MSLEEKINQQLKQAMLDKNQAAMRGLRAIKAAILLAKTEKGSTGELTADKELQLLQKMVKQRKESIEIFEKQNRADLALVEKEEVAVIEQFLPQKLSLQEVKEVVAKAIAAAGATGAKDMGKVMGLVNKEVAGRADGKEVAEEVKNQLAAL